MYNRFHQKLKWSCRTGIILNSQISSTAMMYVPWCYIHIPFKIFESSYVLCSTIHQFLNIQLLVLSNVYILMCIYTIHHHQLKYIVIVHFKYYRSIFHISPLHFHLIENWLLISSRSWLYALKGYSAYNNLMISVLNIWIEFMQFKTTQQVQFI